MAMADQSGTTAKHAQGVQRREGIDGSAQFQTAKGAPPRTDTMTIVLHWVTAIGMVASLVTGLRIAADNPRAVISKWFEPILPQGEIWTVHFVAGLALFFCATAYALYMTRSGLANRISPKRVQVFMLTNASKLRWNAFNVSMNWLFYALVAVLTVTGVTLYLGYGGWIVVIHNVAAFGTILYLLAHLVGHFGYGGLPQWLRVFRPSRLARTAATRRWPILIGTLAGVAVAIGLVTLDLSTRDHLAIGKVAQPPKLDGVLDDPAWANAKVVSVRTQQGENLGGSGESTVEIRAVHDDKNVYFAFRWEDPTRSLRRLPIIKQQDGWHLVHDNADIADVMLNYEDKLAILFSTSDAFGGGGSTHMGPKPLADKPAPLHQRGYHYTEGDLADLWQWKAARGGHLGMIDDQYFGPPRAATEAENAGTARHQAGYWNDPGRAFYVYNYKGQPPGGYRGTIEVQRLPTDWKATEAKLGRVDLSPEAVDPEGAQWWMTEAETAPYSKELDAAIPVGTVLPGVLIMGNYEGDRAQVHGTPKWADGHWTLEVTRALATGSQFDQDFVPGRPLYMWVSVFDHNQTRHTRHVRPVVVELD
jgi:hypothetical protein